MTEDKWGNISGRRHRQRGFLARIRRDQSGNTLAIMAAALIPMIGMVGSAVDISRAYLVKTRLQQACDAGVLAARRAMAGQSIANDTNARTQATNFFNINLKNGAYGATVTSIAVSDVNDTSSPPKPTGAVHGTASADVPTTLMRIFGKTKLTMNATCEAQLQVANNDVMFVLDTTGSMNCAAADTQANCQDNGLVEKSNARIKALRTAVNNFYSTLNAGTTSGSQLRIGFVPYSTTVNVGDILMAASSDYVANSWSYRTRLANFNTAVYIPNYGNPTSSGVDINGSSVTQAACATYGQNSGSNPVVISGGPPPAATVTKLYANNSTQGVDWGWSGATDTSGTSQSCRRQWTQQNTTYTTRYKFTNWTFGSATYDTSAFKGGSSVSLVMAPANANSGTSVTSPSASLTFATQTSLNEAQLAAADNSLTSTSTTWGGCIEERATIPGQSNFSPIPSGEKDLDFDSLPDATDITTQWHPWWPEVIWGQNSAYNALTQLSTMTSSASMRNWFACPKEAQKLTITNATDVAAYVNSLRAVGFTYHDVGMLWGLRLLSPDGLFRSENQTAPNGKPINRHIIFMTDGDMEPEATSYNLYGHEYSDKRISGTSGVGATNLETLHNARFSAICEAAKAKNITVWVIAYAQTMTTQLQNCASGTSAADRKAYYAGDDTALNTVLQTIASQIAELRLSA
jgi:Flp pilus assembly protein TadG